MTRVLSAVQPCFALENDWKMVILGLTAENYWAELGISGSEQFRSREILLSLGKK